MTSEKKFTVYEMIGQDIKQKILSGEYKPNEKLPSVLELCKIYKTSDATVRKSFEILKKEGYVYSQKRIGIFVADYKLQRYVYCFHELENLKNHIDNYKCLSLAEKKVESLDLRIWEKMGACPLKKCLRIERMYYADILPIVYRIDYIGYHANLNFIKSNADKWIKEMDSILDSFDIRKAIRIKIDSQDEEIRNKMIIPDDVGIFHIEKTHKTHSKKFVAFSDIFVAATDFIFKVDIE